MHNNDWLRNVYNIYKTSITTWCRFGQRWGGFDLGTFWPSDCTLRYCDEKFLNMENGRVLCSTNIHLSPLLIFEMPTARSWLWLDVLPLFLDLFASAKRRWSNGSYSSRYWNPQLPLPLCGHRRRKIYKAILLYLSLQVHLDKDIRPRSNYIYAFFIWTASIVDADVIEDMSFGALLCKQMPYLPSIRKSVSGVTKIRTAFDKFGA